MKQRNLLWKKSKIRNTRNIVVIRSYVGVGEGWGLPFDEVVAITNGFTWIQFYETISRRIGVIEGIDAFSVVIPNVIV